MWLLCRFYHYALRPYFLCLVVYEAHFQKVQVNGFCYSRHLYSKFIPDVPKKCTALYRCCSVLKPICEQIIFNLIKKAIT